MSARDAYLIFEPDDRYHASLCYGEDDAREIISGIKDTSHVRVHRVTPDELVRDVTDYFFPEEDETPEPVFNRTAYLRRSGMFGR